MIMRMSSDHSDSDNNMKTVVDHAKARKKKKKKKWMKAYYLLFPKKKHCWL